MGFGIHGLCSRLTTDPEDEQRDMGYHGSTYEDGSLHNHEKHVDIGLARPSLPGGDSSIAWCVELYNVRPRYKVPIGILAEAVRGVWDTVSLQYSFSHEWAD